MKRLLAFLLSLLLLSGCVAEPTQPTTEPTTQPTTAPTTELTQPPVPSLYDGSAALEVQTGGAVRVYPLHGYCDGVILMGDQVVLYYLDEQMQMKAYSGENLQQVSTATHHIRITTESLQVTEDFIRYYDAASRTLVVLGKDLHQKYRVQLPADIQGLPVVSATNEQIYFCTAAGIRVMDITTGIAHMLRQQDGYTGALQGSCFDGKLLVCSLTGSDGNPVTEFISAQTGLVAGQDPGVGWINTMDDRYILERNTQEGNMVLFGARDGQVYRFRGTEGQVIAALTGNSVLVKRQGEAGVMLDQFDLTTGLRTASVTLPGLTQIRNVTMDDHGFVWFLDETTLYRWDPAKSPVDDETVYTEPWYTDTNPNEAGLAQCQADAQALGEKYGLQIRIWKDANTGPWAGMTAEFRVEAYTQALAELDAVFSLFPEDMLAQLGSLCADGAVQISLVADTGGDPGQQTWFEGNAHIVLELDGEVRQALLRTLYRVMDTFVLSKNSILDEWDAERPTQDRTEYFLAALTEDNASYFDGYRAYNKLYTLCRAIRRAFGMRDYEAELPWEQYLNEPMY